MSKSVHFPIVIVGGGTAGITIAAQLRKKRQNLAVALIEPSSKHYYQPLWTLVGGGVFPKADSERDESTLIPDGVTWIKDAVDELRPGESTLLTRDGREITYQYLVMTPGLQIDWGKIKGLTDSLGKDGVCSNYSYEHVDKTWQFIREFHGGQAVFTQPNTPVKCGGAPQKIAYLAEDYFNISKVRGKCNIIFASAQPSIFSVRKYADSLNQVIERKGIETRFRHNLVEIDAARKEAIFERLDLGDSVAVKYDLLHVTPPMSAPDFIKRSELAGEGGWVDVNKGTLQHNRFENVFACGDAASLPTSKTGAAIRKQAPVLVDNMLAHLDGRPMMENYTGYTSCPLVTGYHSLILAEFDYELAPQETFPFDQSRERYSMYLLKKYVLPAFYWEGMLKGHM